MWSSYNQPGTFKCSRTQCKTCPFISNMVKISGPNRSVKITDHFTRTSANVICCITCTLCYKTYIGETGRRLADRFREHLRVVEKNDTDASKPVARPFHLLNHSHHIMTICSLSLHHGNTEIPKNLEQKFIFRLGTLYPLSSIIKQFNILYQGPKIWNTLPLSITSLSSLSSFKRQFVDFINICKCYSK